MLQGHWGKLQQENQNMFYKGSWALPSTSKQVTAPHKPNSLSKENL